MEEFYEIKKMNESVLDIFSSERVKMQKKNKNSRELQKKIRNSINNFSFNKEKMLYAEFNTSKEFFFDVENILFYNIGAFESVPKDYCIAFLCPKTKIKSHEVKYRYYYSIREKNLLEDIFLQEDMLLDFSYNGIRSARLNSTENNWYLAKKEVGDLNKPQFRDYITDLGLDLKVDVTNRKLLSNMKTIIDGIISALHFTTLNEKNNINYDKILYKINAGKINQQEVKLKEVINLLNCKKHALLGERKKLLCKNGRWNPKDEVLRVCRICPNSEKKNIVKIYNLTKRAVESKI